MSSPVRLASLRLRWPPAGAELEARAARNARMPLFGRRSVVLARTFLYYVILRYGIRVGRFVPTTYHSKWSRIPISVNSLMAYA